MDSRYARASSSSPGVSPIAVWMATRTCLIFPSTYVADDCSVSGTGNQRVAPLPSTKAIPSRPSSSVPTLGSVRLTMRVAWMFSPMTVKSRVSLIYA
jgi:hypothetical protein